jgi:hypothetical protein
MLGNVELRWALFWRTEVLKNACRHTAGKAVWRHGLVHETVCADDRAFTYVCNDRAFRMDDCAITDGDRPKIVSLVEEVLCPVSKPMRAVSDLKSLTEHRALADVDRCGALDERVRCEDRAITDAYATSTADLANEPPTELDPGADLQLAALRDVKVEAGPKVHGPLKFNVTVTMSGKNEKPAKM